jgi:hypothetical protein
LRAVGNSSSLANPFVIPGKAAESDCRSERFHDASSGRIERGFEQALVAAGVWFHGALSVHVTDGRKSATKNAHAILGSGFLI